MPKQQLQGILNFIKKGGKMERIAKYYDIPLRTLSRRLRPYKKEVEIARNYYASVLEGMFK